MAYEPKEWQCGETITADDLNHLEQGVVEASGSSAEPLIVEYGEEIGGIQYLNKTYGEIKEAYLEGRTVCYQMDEGNGRTDFNTLTHFYEVVEEGEAYGTVEFDSYSFPVAGAEVDTATTLEELLEKYPHVYSD